MTTEQGAEYLEMRGWKREGEFWRDKKTTYLWEQSAAVKQQQFRDREWAKKEAKCTTTNGPALSGQWK